MGEWLVCQPLSPTLRWHCQGHQLMGSINHSSANQEITAWTTGLQKQGKGSKTWLLYCREQSTVPFIVQWYKVTQKLGHGVTVQIVIITVLPPPIHIQKRMRNRVRLPVRWIILLNLSQLVGAHIPQSNRKERIKIFNSYMVMITLNGKISNTYLWNNNPD